MMILILAVIVMMPLAMVVAGIAFSGPRYRGPRTDHFDGFRFINPHGMKAKGGVEVLKWMLRRKAPHWVDDPAEHYGKRPLGHFKDGIRITFVNHSTFLIQVDGVNILTDPVWSRRVSPIRWIGPQRKRLPGIRFEDLPRIHLVLLSHNHYDHLDLDTMRMVAGAHHPAMLVPLGVKRFLERELIAGSNELDWWESTAFGNIGVTCVPAQHFSGRGLLDRDATLWCGYVLKTGAGNIYFSGDTGYNGETFKEIGTRCGPIKVSMIPIGAYKPGWFMSPIHVSPEESVKIHRDVASRRSIAMHFGTFPLADDGPTDPIDDLRIAMSEHRLADDEFIVLKEGESIVFE